MLLEMREVSKSFGATRALDGVSLAVAAGETRALIGENGAGKSTLMKILSGAIRPDSGSLWLGGEPFAPRGPREARRKGVAMIYQELALAPDLTVEANVMLGQEQTRLGFIRRRDHQRAVAQALGLLEHPDIHPRAKIRDLGLGARQVVEIARALVAQARVLVLDEPTSTLTSRDAERLFTIVDRLRERGMAIIYISHFLEETRRIAQTYTVLRDGRTAAHGSLAETSERAIITAMVGRALSELFPRTPRAPGAPVLELSEVAPRHGNRPANLTLRRGEVLGLAGLVGAGRTTLLRAIYGLHPVVVGTVRVAAFPDRTGSPRARIAQGVGFASEDRKGEGLALDLSIEDNATLSALERHSRLGFLNLSDRRRAVAGLMESLRIKARGPRDRAANLSGGNQQKVALARLLHQQADVFLLDEPTRGIDVGSKAEIYAMIGRQAAQGRAVLMVSSYLPELLGVCDRIAVMSRGLLSEARPAADWTEHSIMEVATRGAG